MTSFIELGQVCKDCLLFRSCCEAGKEDGEISYLLFFFSGLSTPTRVNADTTLKKLIFTLYIKH